MALVVESNERRLHGSGWKTARNFREPRAVVILYSVTKAVGFRVDSC